MYKIGSIGAGNMGLAIIDGSVNCKAFDKTEVAIFDIMPEKIDLCKSKGYTVLPSEQSIIENCEIVLLAVKPQVYESLLAKLKEAKNRPQNQIIITIAAGISTSYIQKFLGDETKIIRIMPNTPLLIGCGACAFSKTQNVNDNEFENIMNIFKNMGEVAVIPENQMNNIIAANGSSPAYVYYFINCIAKSVENMGVDKDVAKKLVAKTFIGAAEMVLKTGKEPEELIKQVCSPGGTTIESIKVFDEKNLYSIIDEGCVKCVERANELNS
ncbi:pyrroline-5-carboxylate reductase [Sedimentibacter sp. zth1]|uniref:pyrroline-5-carboxylate reductase n=1 Tax=Sedimentibacter sp. zth1 TaxID=2816908 RepID=UPI001A930622|nr:pyrroline-5-carboxylate reductase [Sedimentibacter sp. zth1]QSX04852.1 pyrroline-5-carboxylate reductase [Sedimentibacter sp. zth1]